MKITVIVIVIGVLILMPFASIGAGSSQQHSVVTAAQVNGTWSSKRGGFGLWRVWALGKQRLRVEFYGRYEYNTPAGPIANLGEAHGIAEIEGDTAILKPVGMENRCMIRLQFVGQRLVVSQDGECGFGKHVTSAGEYHKTSRRKPKFGTEPS